MSTTTATSTIVDTEPGNGDVSTSDVDNAATSTNGGQGPEDKGVISNATPSSGLSNLDTTDDNGVGTTDTTEATGETPQSEPDTFPREYVQRLRDENAKYRQRAADRDTLAERLHLALVAATGRLADPTDLPYNEEHLADADNMVAALDDLLARKPHLATRKFAGSVGQGETGTADTVDLAGILRRNAS